MPTRHICTCVIPLSSTVSELNKKCYIYIIFNVITFSIQLCKIGTLIPFGTRRNINLPFCLVFAVILAFGVLFLQFPIFQRSR